MKIRIALASIVFILLIASEVNAQTLQWAKQMGDTLYEQGYAIAVDQSGNVFTTGYFYGTVDFDPGSGISLLTSFGLSDIFISKLDASGNFLWAKKVGGTGWDKSSSIATDAAGNVYYAGGFNETIDFDPDTSVYNLTPVWLYDIYISKLDASGNFIWAKRLGGFGESSVLSMTLDKAGNLYTTGIFDKTVDFDPGGNGTFNLTSVGLNDIFISKLDSSGNFVWAKSFGGSSNDRGRSITIDNSGNIYTTGDYIGAADFDPGASIYELRSQGSTDVFISKLDASGNFIWAKRLGGNLEDRGVSIATDINGNVYTTGRYKATADFDPGPANFVLVANGLSFDMFISKLDAAGNFVWAKRIGGNQDEIVSSINIDRKGNIFTSGWFFSNTDFDPGPGTFNLTSTGSSDIFTSIIDINGNFISAQKIGGVSTDYARSATADTLGNVYITGTFSDTCDFDPDTSTYPLAEAGCGDVFILKLNVPSNVGYQQIEDLKAFRVYPNPTKSNLTLDLRDTYKNIDITIRNVLGEVVSNKSYQHSQDLQLIIPGTNGLYFIEAIADNRKEVWKVIKN